MDAVSDKPKKRDIADFFKSYGNAKQFPKSVIPKKRSSPSQDAEIQKSSDTRPWKPTTPSKQQIPRPSVSPLIPKQAQPTTPSSTKLPIRTPNSKATPRRSDLESAVLHNDGRQSPTRPEAKSPSPKRQTQLNFVPPSIPTPGAVRASDSGVIRDSDAETDSLASLEEIFGRKRDEDETSASSPPEENESQKEVERRKIFSRSIHGRSEPIVGKDRLRQINELGKQHKFDISRLLNDHFDDQEVQTNIDNIRSKYGGNQPNPNVQERRDDKDKLLESLTNFAGGDEDELTRLRAALARTEALSSEKSYSFLDTSITSDQKAKPTRMPPFPESALPATLLTAEIDTDQTRDWAYQSGIIAELAADGSLSDQVLSWTFQAAQLETDSHMRQAYLETLKRGSCRWTRTTVTAEDVQSSFEALGAHKDSIAESKPIEPRYQPLKVRRRPSPQPLIRLLELYQAICLDMDFLALGRLTSILCRIAVDTELMSIGPISTRVEESLSQLLQLAEYEASSHVAQHILDDMRANLTDPSLQAQLLSHILPDSPTACTLRIMLAHVFLLGNEETLSRSNVSHYPISLSELAAYATESPYFATASRRTKLNYIHLRALTHVLDVAVADGGRPTLFTSPDEQNSFNTAVDELADALKQIFEAINDTGATHMKRTEAKDVLQSLHWRLLYAVRTKPRPRKHLFDVGTGKLRDAEDVRVEQRGKDFMTHFLARMKQKKQNEDSNTLLSSQPLSDSSRSENEVLIRRQLGMN